MELDDLKQTWQTTADNNIKNTDIMNLLRHKSYGPVAALKRSFRKDIRIMLILPVILLLSNANDINAALTSIMFWSYTAFCIGIIVFAYRNYQIVLKMEVMDGMVKQNLEQQLTILDNRLKWHMIAVRLALLFFIALTEIVPYFQHYRILDKWHSLPAVIRFGSYAALLLVQYFVSRTVCDIKFGSNVKYLKELIKEMQY